MTLPVALVAAYLVGAIPTSFWVVKLARGEDLRTLGSGNLGATNLYRQLGWGYALPVALFDILKGVFPVVVLAPATDAGALGAVGLGLVAVLGHVFSVFVGFRGGKGVATGAGLVLALTPWAVLVSALAWVVTVRLSGFVSLGSIVAAVLLLPAIWFLHPASRELLLPLSGLVALIVWFHRSNIRRLIAGTENRFGSRAKAASS